MRLSTHDAYLSQLSSQFTAHADDPPFWEALSTYTEALSCLLDLSLDPVRDALEALYCPTGQGDPRDPVTLLRSWLLMTLCREGRPAVWARRLHRESVLAVLAGFVPGDTPGASTHRDFLARLADGPYALRSKQDVPLSQSLTGRHRHGLDEATKARREAADAAGVQQSTLLADTLLTAQTPLHQPDTLQARLEHLVLELGLKPTIAANLLPENLTVAGDGTVEESAASSRGFRACDCPASSRCGCQRDYLSKTAQWCYDTQHGWRFGDRSYTISVHVNGHDVPLMTILPGGNESDFTLSLKALDRLLTLLETQDLPLRIAIFIGDGHHDAIGIYRYLKAKGILPVIPLKGSDDGTTASTSPATHPALTTRPDISLAFDGTPLCPGGCRMRHASYCAAKDSHYYACPHTRKQRDGSYRFSADQCPNGQPCRPDKAMGYGLYLPGHENPRYVVPIPRDSKRFKDLYAHRSGTERENASADSYHLDRRHRNAALVLIRLTFVNIIKHARLREAERHPSARATEQMHDALQQLGLTRLLPN